LGIPFGPARCPRPKVYSLSFSISLIYKLSSRVCKP
jgi:hypothetical protein